MQIPCSHELPSDSSVRCGIRTRDRSVTNPACYPTGPRRDIINIIIDYDTICDARQEGILAIDLEEVQFKGVIDLKRRRPFWIYRGSTDRVRGQLHDLPTHAFGSREIPSEEQGSI